MTDSCAIGVLALQGAFAEHVKMLQALGVTAREVRKPAQLADLDGLNRKLAETVQREGKAFLTTTELNGQLVLRACIVNFRTTEADLDILLDAIAEAGGRVPTGD